MKICFKMLFALLLCVGTANAQTEGRITGKLEDKNRQPLASVLVSLLFSKDNSLVKTQLTEADGTFLFDHLPEGSYLIAVEDPGYKAFLGNPVSIGPDGWEYATLPIVLENAETNVLKEVTIQKKKPFIERKIDRTVVNVDAMISNAGSDALSVLEKAPGIIVNDDGTITLKGKSGVMVFIDDKPANMSGSDLEMYLKSLPASTLDQIEIITNPPAKYDAAGKAGIVNFISKKTKVKGFNGTVSSSVTKARGWQTRQAVALNYAHDKIRIFGNASYAFQEMIYDLNIFRRFKNEDGSTKSQFDQDTHSHSRPHAANVKIGMDYYASEKTTFGVNVSGLIRTGNDKKYAKGILENGAGVLDSTVIADNRTERTFTNGGINLNYRHQFDDAGKKLVMDADYLRYENKLRQRFLNYVYQPDGALDSSDELRGHLPSVIDIYSYKADYSHPLPENALFETGYKVSYSRTDNIADYADVVAGVPVPNYDSSNHFKYDEIINAVYVNYNKSFGRFGFQAGLRLENTVSKGHQLGNEAREGSRFKRDYTNLFPTAYLSYKLDSIGNNHVVLSYGKRIDRPYYQDLNPFLSPLDKFTYYSGNPYLDPSFSHVTELNYNYKNLFAVGVSYSYTKDEIDETIEINDGIYYSRPGNISRSEDLTFSISGDHTITKWYSTSTYLQVATKFYKSRLYDTELDGSGSFFYGFIVHRFRFDKSWSGEVLTRYQSEVRSNQFTLGDRGSLNLAVQKKVLSDKGSLKLSINDLLRTSINYGTINNLVLTDANFDNKGDSRFVSLTFTYGFGKRAESRQRHDKSGAESEQNRVKE